MNEKADALLENDGDTKYGSAVGLVGDDLDVGAERSKLIDLSKVDIDIDVWGFDGTTDKLPELEEGVSSVWSNSSSLHKKGYLINSIRKYLKLPGTYLILKLFPGFSSFCTSSTWELSDFFGFFSSETFVESAWTVDSLLQMLMQVSLISFSA